MLPDMIKLRLYVTGQTPTSRALTDQLHALFQQEYPDRYHLEVLDIFEHTESAMADDVMVTPTLMRMLPMPVRRLIGDLGNRERVLAGLSIESDGE